MTARRFFCLLALLSVLIVNPSGAHAQTAPLPIGTFTADNQPASCPQSAGWLQGGICTHYTITCTGADALGVTVDYVAPTGTSKGTIAFVSAESGTSPNTTEGQELTFAQYYLSQNFAVVQTAWDKDWEDTDTAGDSGGDSLLVAACRPATVLSAINASTTYHPTGAMCAQGASAGAGGAGFSLEWYGAKSYLNNVELLSGPVFSDMRQGCEVHPTAGPVTICGSGQVGCNNEYGDTTSWNNNPQYIDFYLTAVQGWIGGGSGTMNSCGNPSGTSSQADQAWFNMSILATGGDSTYNNTSMAVWVCAGTYKNYQSGTCPANSSHCPNNSGSQGALFGQQFTTANEPQPHYAFVGVNTCKGEEGVTGMYATTPDGTGAMSAIESDMLGHCKVGQ